MTKKYIAKDIDFSVNKRCINCNACCTVNLPLFDDEFEKLKSIIMENEINIIESLRKIQKSGKYYLMCPFSDLETKKCQIYNDRPTVCRIYRCNQKEKFRLLSEYISNHGFPKFTKSLVDAFPEDIREHIKEGLKIIEEKEAEGN